MGIEQITEKILFDANEAARREMVKAKYHGRESIRKARCLGDDLKEEAHGRALRDSLAVKEQRKSVAELEARKMRLAAKQEGVARCFDRAADQLANLPKEEYLELLVKALGETGAEGGEIMLNERDRKSIGEELTARANALGTCGTLTLSASVIPAKGGFVLKVGPTFLNSTLETMVEAVKEEMTPQVVRTLFD